MSHPRRLACPAAAVAAALLPAMARGQPARGKPTPGSPLPPDAAVLAVLRARVDAGQAAGLVVALVDAHTRIVAYGRGAAGAPLDAHSVFEVGSVTKTFTAAALASMAADGTVRLDQPVAELLPRGTAMPSRDGRPIRLVDLATQTSGLPRLPDNFAPRDPADPYADYDGARLLAFLARYQLPSAPGGAYEYSNLGAGLLGYALAARAGTSYEQLVASRVLRPLGMTETAVTLGPALRARLAPGHDATGAEVKGWTFDALASAGALRSTAADMARYVAAHIAAPPATVPALAAALAATHVKRAETGVPDLGIGLAWHVATPSAGQARGDTLVWHNGQTGGYASFVGFSPARGVGVVVLSNTARSVDDLALTLLTGAPTAGAAAAAATPPPAARTALALPVAALDRFVGEYPLAPTFVIAVRREGERLLAQATGQPALELFADSPTTFFLRAVDARVEFQTDAAGAVTGLVLVQNGMRQSAPKRVATTPSAATGTP